MGGLGGGTFAWEGGGGGRLLGCRGGHFGGAVAFSAVAGASFAVEQQVVKVWSLWSFGSLVVLRRWDFEGRSSGEIVVSMPSYLAF